MNNLIKMDNDFEVLFTIILFLFFMFCVFHLHFACDF